MGGVGQILHNLGFLFGDKTQSLANKKRFEVFIDYKDQTDYLLYIDI